MIGKLARINRTQLIEELNRLTIIDSDDRSNSSGVISLAKLAEMYDVPVESILQIVKDSGDTNVNASNPLPGDDSDLIALAKLTEIKPHLGNDIGISTLVEF
jgi:hypothetical protein